MDDSIEIPLLKIITLGNSSVGKTSIIKQYTNKTFEADLINTIGIDVKNHETTIEGIQIKVRIWDTAGQERFRSIQKQYYIKLMEFYLYMILQIENHLILFLNG